MASSVDNDILTELFLSGRPYKTILEKLRLKHGTTRSMSWLKRRFRKLGLKKRCPDPPEDVLEVILQELITTPDGLRGYRSIWQTLRTKYKLIVRRDTVMKLLRQIDPVGGPNFIWHLDGFDKLTPYGLSIHGCIDGYSRKIIWLKLVPSNHNPAIIARLYLEAIEDAGGCPKILRTDLGTENCSVAKLHISFRLNHVDTWAGTKSFIYGPSTANTRIESWWAMLRRYKVDWWMDLCRSLQAEGKFNKANNIHRYTMGLIFGSLLNNDLSEFVTQWNEHPIRKNSQTISPHGRPNDIYEMPSLHETSDHLMPIDTNLWAHCMLNQSSSVPPLCPISFQNFGKDVLFATLGLTMGDITHTNCRNVYLKLIHSINTLVSNGSFRMPLSIN